MIKKRGQFHETILSGFADLSNSGLYATSVSLVDQMMFNSSIHCTVQLFESFRARFEPSFLDCCFELTRDHDVLLGASFVDTHFLDS